jgi:ATP-dependent DNA helicase RecQ
VGNFLDVSVGDGFQRMYDFNFNLFCRTYDLPVLPTHNALKILTQAGYIEFVEEIETQSRVMILARKEQLYDLKTVTPGADQVLQSILRLYTGLFADYVFINEDVIAFRTGLNQETIYNSLLELSRMHVLHYVPRKRTPYIIYTTSREEPKYVLIPRAVYEDLRQRMTDRVEATINYAYSDTGCRERMLLGYFGERRADACGQCDLCIDMRKREDHAPGDVQQGILYMAGLRPRRLEEFLSTLSFPRDEVISMLSFLVDEGFIEHLEDDTYATVKR